MSHLGSIHVCPDIGNSHTFSTVKQLDNGVWCNQRVINETRPLLQGSGSVRRQKRTNATLDER